MPKPAAKRSPEMLILIIGLNFFIKEIRSKVIKITTKALTDISIP